MQTLQSKLRSRRGASLTFALLLFLVCAVIASVVIVAGTTAAGRMSQMAPADQRYYAAMSAARLLKSQIDGKKVIVTPSAAESTEDTEEDEGEAETGVVTTAPPRDLLTDVSEKMAECLNKGETKTANYALSTNLENTALACNITETVGADGLLTYRITSGSTIDAVYQVEITFASNRKESRDPATGERQLTLKWEFLRMKKLRGAAATGGEGT